MAQIEIKNLNFAYNGSLVLKNINYRFEEGKLISIVGPNGSGKSTMLKCLDNIIQPGSGEVTLDHKNIFDFKINELARKIAYVAQSENATFPASVFDTILLTIVAEMIKKLDLDQISLKNINKLSGGQRQRVFIARALAQQPEILLLDEPTANLDLKHQLEVLKILKHLSKQGITVIIAIPDLNLALQFSDRFVLLKSGELFASGGKEIISQPTIEKLYDIEVKIIEDHGQFIIVPKT